jgi:hypothetical protein
MPVKKRNYIEDKARKMLREKGISGSAVRVVDVDAAPERFGPLNDSAVSFRKKLATVREKIVK